MTRAFLPRWAQGSWVPVPTCARQLAHFWPSGTRAHARIRDKRVRECLTLLEDITEQYYGTGSDLVAGRDWLRVHELAALSREMKAGGERLRPLVKCGALKARKLVSKDRPGWAEYEIRLTDEPLEIWERPAWPRRDTTHGNDPLCSGVRSNLERLEIPEGRNPQTAGLGVYPTCQLQRCAARALHGRLNVTRGDNNRRISHVLTSPGSRALRSEVRLDGEQLAVVDIKSAHPLLLCARMRGCKHIDPHEVSRLVELITRSDIYSALAPSTNRDVAKRAWMRIQSGYVWPERFELHASLASQFPSITAALVKAREIRSKRGLPKLNCTLQQMEAAAVIDTVLRAWALRDRFMIPIHDGALARSADAIRLAHDLRRAMAEVNGVSCSVTVDIVGQKRFVVE